MTTEEFKDLKTICAYAESKCDAAQLTTAEGAPINLYTYTWRYREGGVDTTHNVRKPTHLHIHMWPERDGLMTSISDPEAHTWDPGIFKSLNTSTQFEQ